MNEHSQLSWAPTRESRSWPTSTGGIFARRSSAFTTGFWRRQSPPGCDLKLLRLPRRIAESRGLANSTHFCGILDLSHPGGAVEEVARSTVAPMGSATRRVDIARQFA